MSEKLSDLIKWEPDVLNLLDSVLARMRTHIAEECKMDCFKTDKPKINKSVLLKVLHDIKPVAWFVDPED